ncbi:unnamed protein product, partial [Clonostachys rhizophaga]
RLNCLAEAEKRNALGTDQNAILVDELTEFATMSLIRIPFQRQPLRQTTNSTISTLPWTTSMMSNLYGLLIHPRGTWLPELEISNLSLPA